MPIYQAVFIKCDVPGCTHSTVAGSGVGEHGEFKPVHVPEGWVIENEITSVDKAASFGERINMVVRCRCPNHEARR